MSQLYPIHLGERDKYHVVEYPQGYSGLIRPDGSEVTSLTEPEDIHWHRELKPIHDELNKLHQQLATLTQERDALKRIIDDTLREVPVGYIPAHTPENLPQDMKHYVQETVKQDFEIEKLQKERDALREAVEELVRLGNLMERFMPSYGMQLDAKANWQQESTHVVAKLLTPSGEAGKGGGA